MTNLLTFEEIYEQNKRRIHYQIHRLNIQSPYEEFFQEGLCAMWHAYEKYNPDKGPMSTYFNYTIRNRLVIITHPPGIQFTHTTYRSSAGQPYLSPKSQILFNRQPMEMALLCNNQGNAHKGYCRTRKYHDKCRERLGKTET